MQSILEIVPNIELARTWPSKMTIMMRMTSKIMRDAIDKAKLPATISLIWPKYRKNILKINKIFELINIINLNIKCFDFESDFESNFNFECDESIEYDEERHEDKQIVKIVEEVEIDNEESIEYDESIEYEEDKLLILFDMFSLNEGITVLNLEYCDLKNNSLKFFTKLQNLSKLNLKGNNFSWSLEFIELLLMLPKLVCLNLDFNENFNKKGCVISQLSHDQFLHLEELSLNHCNIACGSYDILKLIQICPKLVRLNLENNGLNEEWMKRLEQALSHCPDLAYLDLNCNYINDVGNLINLEIVNIIDVLLS
jgi:hypothetical protein